MNPPTDVKENIYPHLKTDKKRHPVAFLYTRVTGCRFVLFR